MGTNVHALAHRLTALSMACLALTGLICCCLSGFGCSFIKIKALNGESVGNAFGDVYEEVETAYLGVQCLSGNDAPFYDINDSVDRLWNISRIFLYTGLGLGVMTTLFALFLGTCIRPTAPRWQILSVLAACSAVSQIPIFLVFESDNCNFDVTRQTCELATCAYLNALSVSIWIVMTIWVQFLRAPRWDEELDAWRAKGDTGPSSLFPGQVAKSIGNETIESKASKCNSGGFGGNETAETSEITNSPKRRRKQSRSSCSSRLRRVGKMEEIEKMHEQQHQGRHRFDNSIEEFKDKSSTGAENATVSNIMMRKRSEKPLPITNALKQNLNNKKVMGKNTSFDFVRSMRNSNKPERSLSGTKESALNSSEEAHLACNTQELTHEAPMKTKGCAKPTGSTGYVGAAGDKFEAVDTGKHAVNQPQNTIFSTASFSRGNRVAPGFHMSCVHANGTRQEIHFPSLDCCIGMGHSSVEEEETKFQTYPQTSDDSIMVGFDDYNNFDDKNSSSADYLVRKLRREEQAAAARRAELNMAPVASFEFVSQNSIINGDRRKQRNNDHSDVIFNDDVSEMTRGSGLASGVSEILDDTDLRHQPKAILKDLTEQY
mmetsp:Transcript_16826/g.38864  ORF Transcript_16826/g.38864 Transcript_16826/m.38864 type:complete len:603 (-) Transcript_16826:26-1834(-)